MTGSISLADVAVMPLNDGRLRPITTSDLAWFFRSFETTESGCWIWTARRTKTNYAHFSAGRNLTAHRFAYLAMVGMVQPGMQLDHVCHSKDQSCPGGVICEHRACVNPLHLEQVTPRENTLRSQGPAALNAQKTHCSKGHPFGGPLARTNARGWRICKVCERSRRRQSYARSTDRPVADPARDKYVSPPVDGVSYVDRRYGPKEACPSGHPYDEANTYISPKGGRRCRTCSKLHKRLHRESGTCGYVSARGNACARPMDHEGQHSSITHLSRSPEQPKPQPCGQTSTTGNVCRRPEGHSGQHSSKTNASRRLQNPNDAPDCGQLSRAGNACTRPAGHVGKHQATGDPR